MTALRAPFPWFGGKSRVAPLVWTRFGDLPNYVEPFAGSLAVLLGRPTPPLVETVNDLDCYLANFWRALTADPDKVARYADSQIRGGGYCITSAPSASASDASASAAATGSVCSGPPSPAASARAGFYRARERIWFSPHCIKAEQMELI